MSDSPIQHRGLRIVHGESPGFESVEQVGESGSVVRGVLAQEEPAHG